MLIHLVPVQFMNYREHRATTIVHTQQSATWEEVFGGSQKDM